MVRHRLAPFSALGAAILLAACSTSPSPSATPASGDPSPVQNLVSGGVTSERFGWSMELPEPAWEYRPATEDWPPNTYPAPGAAYTDNFEPPGESFPVIDISTQQLPAGQTQADFMAFMDQGNVSIGCTAESTEDITVAGAPARYQRQSCASGNETAWEVIAFDGDRVYVIYWIDLADAAESGEPIFREIVESFTFAD